MTARCAAACARAQPRTRSSLSGPGTEIQALLDQRLEYKQESGQLYLTEDQPMLQAGVVRRDGLTVSLIVSGQADEILRVYDGLG